MEHYYPQIIILLSAIIVIVVALLFRMSDKHEDIAELLKNNLVVYTIVPTYDGELRYDKIFYIDAPKQLSIGSLCERHGLDDSYLILKIEADLGSSSVKYIQRYNFKTNEFERIFDKLQMDKCELAELYRHVITLHHVNEDAHYKFKKIAMSPFDSLEKYLEDK